jgi:5-(carboxyamino)imidazole ribonucleotide mutase
MKRSRSPRVGIIMGSDSDWPTLEPAAETCREFGVPCEVRVVSAHRTPEDMMRYAQSAEARGLRVIIAGAGGAAHLPGMVASLTPLPVIGVPVESRALKGLDSLLSIAQMPGGVPVATMAIGGGRNAGLLAVKMLGIADAGLRRQLERFAQALADESRRKDAALAARLARPSAPTL